MQGRPNQCKPNLKETNTSDGRNTFNTVCESYLETLTDWRGGQPPLCELSFHSCHILNAQREANGCNVNERKLSEGWWYLELLMPLSRAEMSGFACECNLWVKAQTSKAHEPLID